MSVLSPEWLFLILGPFFLVIAGIRWGGVRRFSPQVRTWVILGVIFSLVAAWLWLMKPPIT
jgi:hypothetical protein